MPQDGYNMYETAHTVRAGTSPELLKLWTGFVRAKGIESIFTSTSSQGDCTKFPVVMTGISVWSTGWHDFNQRDLDIKSPGMGCSTDSHSYSTTCWSRAPH